MNSHAQLLDKSDPLANKRQEFLIPDNTIYLDGNSLGPLTLKAKERAEEVINQQWGNDLIKSWNMHQWIDLPQSVGAKIAKLIGAKPEEVICCDSTSINLFKLLATGLELNPQRSKIVSSQDNFPTDLYMAEGLEHLIGSDRCHLILSESDSLLSHLDENTAVLFLTQVNFRTGEILDIEQITRSAQKLGVLVIWDLAHSAGVMPLQLSDWNVDFAIGCGYKYLNGGPGAPAFVYAAERYHHLLHQPLTGWFGHAEPFAFASSYQPDKSIKQFLTGTPPIISMSVLDAALDVYKDVELDIIREKSLKLTDYFYHRLSHEKCLNELILITPTQHHKRGSQLSFSHPHAYAICQAWIEKGMIADFRAPDILRVGFSPLYLTFEELEHAVSTLVEIMKDHLFMDNRYQIRHKVT